MTTSKTEGDIMGPVPAHLFRTDIHNHKDRDHPSLRILGFVRSCAYSSQLCTVSMDGEQERRTRILLKLEFIFIPGDQGSPDDTQLRLAFPRNAIVGFDTTDGGENACLELSQHQFDASRRDMQLGVHLDAAYQDHWKSTAELSDGTRFVVHKSPEMPRDTIVVRIPGKLKLPSEDPVTLRLAVLVGIHPTASYLECCTDAVYKLRYTSPSENVNHRRQGESSRVRILQIDSMRCLGTLRGGGAWNTPQKEEKGLPTTPSARHDSPAFGLPNEEAEMYANNQHTQPSLHAAFENHQPRHPPATALVDPPVVLQTPTGNAAPERNPEERTPRRRTTTERLGLPSPFSDNPDAAMLGEMYKANEKAMDGPFMSAFATVALCLFVEDALKIGMAATKVPRPTEQNASMLAKQAVQHVKLLGRTISICETLRVLCLSEDHSRILVRESATRQTMYAAVWHAVRDEIGSTAFL